MVCMRILEWSHDRKTASVMMIKSGENDVPSIFTQIQKKNLYWQGSSAEFRTNFEECRIGQHRIFLTNLADFTENTGRRSEMITKHLPKLVTVYFFVRLGVAAQGPSPPTNSCSVRWDIFQEQNTRSHRILWPPFFSSLLIYRWRIRYLLVHVCVPWGPNPNPLPTPCPSPTQHRQLWS